MVAVTVDRTISDPHAERRFCPRSPSRPLRRDDECANRSSRKRRAPTLLLAAAPAARPRSARCSPSRRQPPRPSPPRWWTRRERSAGSPPRPLKSRRMKTAGDGHRDYEHRAPTTDAGYRAQGPHAARTLRSGPRPGRAGPCPAGEPRLPYTHEPPPQPAPDPGQGSPPPIAVACGLTPPARDPNRLRRADAASARTAARTTAGNVRTSPRGPARAPDPPAGRQ
jgi:hypothetical protein